jgi:GTP cyclohydrolase III
MECDYMSIVGIKELIRASKEQVDIYAELDEVIAQINSIAFEHGFDNELTLEDFKRVFQAA